MRPFRVKSIYNLRLSDYSEFPYHSWGVGINHLLFRSVLQVPDFPFKIILLLDIWIALPSYDVEVHHYSLHSSSRH